jgi:hypothetical protein
MDFFIIFIMCYTIFLHKNYIGGNLCKNLVVSISLENYQIEQAADYLASVNKDLQYIVKHPSS